MLNLKLYKLSLQYANFLKDKYPDIYEIEKTKIYVCVGTFHHAPGHVLFCEFGTWKLSGMHDLCNYEQIENHPDDYVVFT